MFKKSIEIKYHFYFSTGDEKVSYTLNNITDEQAQAIADSLTLGRHSTDRKAGHYFLSVTKTENIRFEREAVKWSDFTNKNYTHIVETEMVEVYSLYGKEFDERTTTTTNRVLVYTGEFVNGFGKNSYISGIKYIKFRQ